MSRRGWVLFLTLGVVWGIPYLLIKVAVRELEPTVVVFGRTLLGAAVLLPVALARRQVLPVLRRWQIMAVYTAVELGVPWFLLSDAERRLPSSVTGLLVAAVPLIGVVILFLAERERPATRQVAGLLVGLAGVGALVGLDLNGADLLSVGAVGLVAVGYATGPYLISRHLSDLPTLGVVAVSITAAAVAYLPAAALQAPSALPSWRVLAAVVVLGLVCTALAFLLVFQLIAEVGPVRATVITYVNPAVAVALGVGFLGERFTVGTAVGFALVLAGSALSTRRSAPPRSRPTGTAGVGAELGGGAAVPGTVQIRR